MSRRAMISYALVGTGFAALAYQQVWFRLFQGIFGATTLATSTVLAVFLGGIGLGSVAIGRRVDRVARPLALYAGLEAFVACWAALTPALLGVAEDLYLASGGTRANGWVVATAIRGALATAVLLPGTVAMGGTLPAALRALRGADDRHGGFGTLYAANTAGAILGTVWAAFFGFERLGVVATLYVAVGVNLAVAGAAWAAARREAPVPATDAAPLRLGARPALAVAAAVGVAFLAMEGVWYRALAPLTGGTSYTFSLVLAVALAGIAVGSAVYAAGIRPERVTLGTVGITCAVEAILVALPLALGDDVAILAAGLRSLNLVGLGGLMSAWMVVTAILVLGPALVAGYQYPMLLAVVGQDPRSLGNEAGLVGAFNTLGTMVGALAVGFVCLPTWGAVATWRGVVALLVAVAVGCALADRSRRALALAPIAAVLASAPGPTAVWRHAGIGVGLWDAPDANPNAVRRRFHQVNWGILWEHDGVETTVAVDRSDGTSFVVNGKSDGHVTGDAPTQVIAGLVGAMLHPDPRNAFVLGLGTGSTAGWLGAVPSIARVDVAELEPGVVRFARESSAVNHDLFGNAKVTVHVGDGRELLATSDVRYDVVLSEPSNPYRAGVASLYTEDFYRIVHSSLTDDGVFLQWVQAYDVDNATLGSVYATLGAVFPSVETWELTQGLDLLLVASKQPIRHDLERVRTRMGEQPFFTAWARVLGVVGPEAFYAGYVAGPSFARQIADQHQEAINTDDRPLLELRFARGSVGRDIDVPIPRLYQEATRAGASRLPVPLDPVLVEEVRALAAVAQQTGITLRRPLPPDATVRTEIRAAWAAGQLDRGADRWPAGDRLALGPMDLVLLAELHARAADPRALAYAEALGDFPCEAAAVRAAFADETGDRTGAVRHALGALDCYRGNPWASPPLMRRTLDLAVAYGLAEPSAAPVVFAALDRPFAVRLLDERRLDARERLLQHLDPAAHCAAVLTEAVPWFPWTRSHLEMRVRCLETLGSPALAGARRDLAEYAANDTDGPLLRGSPPPQP